MRALLLSALMSVSLISPAFSQDAVPFADDPDEDAFITSNVVAVFYHELAHGLIHILNIPVLGKEEDAADTLSSLLIDKLWTEEDADTIVYNVAQEYDISSAQTEADDGALADVHSLDAQRYFNYVCLFYGAKPDQRQATADELALPEDRAAGCPAEYEQASKSWGTFIDGLVPSDTSYGLEMVTDKPDDPTVAALNGEIGILNEKLGLPEPITVKVEDCGEANAFYSPDDKTITFCNEFVAEFARNYESQQ